MKSSRHESRSEEETAAIGQEIAGALPDDAIIHVLGDLGAGKTTLIRSIAAARGADPREVASPSFAIIHEYPVDGAAPIIHIDGYRLSDNRREWLEIGIDEILGSPGLKFIEWPRRELDAFGRKSVQIELRVAPDETREITVAWL